MRDYWWTIVLVAILIPPNLSLALSPGSDILVPAAGRGGPWVTDLYILNPGQAEVSATVRWLVRGQANPSPAFVPLDIAPGETVILEDVILGEFGVVEGSGAFRVDGDGEVVVNSRIYATDGSTTFGQGFEGVPSWAATTDGGSTDVVGLTQGYGFRTNVYALAGPDGASISLSLRDPTGSEIASKELVLGVYQPYLKRVNQLFSGLADFRDGTLHASVTTGTAVIGASKVDNATTDPTTLESSVSFGIVGTPDGVYQISIYDSDQYAGGGNVVVTDNRVTAMTATYFNWDKEDAVGVSECIEQFLLKADFDPPRALGDFADGVVIEQVFDSGGTLEFTVTMALSDNVGFSGTVDADGSGFPVSLEGCNGVFPTLRLSGGKGN